MALPVEQEVVESPVRFESPRGLNFRVSFTTWCRYPDEASSNSARTVASAIRKTRTRKTVVYWNCF